MLATKLAACRRVGLNKRFHVWAQVDRVKSRSSRVHEVALGSEGDWLHLEARRSG
jgi:hypothetical protein